MKVVLAQYDQKYIISSGAFSLILNRFFSFFIQGFSGEVVYYGFFVLVFLL